MARRFRRRKKSRVEPTIILAWHPEVLTPGEYTTLVLALADLARANGAAGIRRVTTETVELDVGSGVLA